MIRIYNEEKTSFELHLSVPIISKEAIDFCDEQLGKGGFGTVCKAIWLRTDVAVKSIKLSSNNKYIFQEIGVLDKIRYPNIISIMAVNMDESHCFIVMEYFNGVNACHLC